MANQPAGFQFAKPYDPTNPVSNDMRYGKYNGTTTVPFASIAEANDLIKPALRYQGLQCAIMDGGTVKLFWYREGTANGDLVLLQTDVNISGKEDVANKTPTIGPATGNGAASDARYPTERAVRNELNLRQLQEPGKGLSEANYTNTEKSKLGNIITGFTLSFTAPVKEIKDHFEQATSIVQIKLDGATTLQYSLNNGTSYLTPTLPLTTPINIAANTWVRWRVAFSLNSTIAAAYIKLA